MHSDSRASLAGVYNPGQIVDLVEADYNTPETTAEI
jgi:hypothetical protein